MKFFPGIAFAALLMVWNSPSGAQTSSTQRLPDSSYVLVLDHEFSSLGEPVRVFLQDRQVYRAELSSPDVVLGIRGVIRTTQAPRVYPFLASRTPSGTTLIEIYPEADAEYEIRSLVVGGGLLPTRLRLYRDVAGSSRRQHVRANRAWDVGVELAGGWHSGFAQSSGAPATDSDPASGTDLEGCFTARGAAASSRLTMCALGVGYQSQHGARSIVWIYTEPRLRLLGRAGSGRSGWELGPLFRFGVGMISTSPATPVLIAPGAYIARYLRSASGAGGWSFQVSYSHPFYKGFSRPIGAEEVTPKGHRLSFGVGWYR